MKSAGGTELQVNYLNKYLDLSKYENINLIINQAAFKRIEAKKKKYFMVSPLYRSTFNKIVKKC